MLEETGPGTLSDIRSNSEAAPRPLPSVIDVAIVEDRREIREGLQVLVGGTSGFRCTGSYETMEQALQEIGARVPDVLLVDIGLPGMSGIDGIRRLKEMYPRLALLVLTIYEDDKRIFEALCAGASGYLLKGTAPARLLESIREIASGGAPMSPEVASRVVRLFREFRPPERASFSLTQQEGELLRLIVDGHHYKTAAKELGISVNTVSFHLKNIYAKLHVHSKSEAVAKAIRERLV